MTDSPSSNAAPAVNPQAPAPGSQPAAGQQAPAGGSQPQPEQGTTPAPGTTGNEPQGGLSFESVFDDERRKYLESQGVKSFEDLSKLVDGHKELRGRAAAQPKTTMEDALKGVTGGGGQQQPVQQPEPAQPAQQQPVQQPQPTQAQPTTTPGIRMPSQLETYQMGSAIKSEFKNIEDVPALIEKMGRMGIAPVDENGYRFEAIMEFAKEQDKLLGYQKEIEALKNPSKDTNPGVRHDNVDYNQPRPEQMTLQAAQNIIMMSERAKNLGQPIHPDYEQAVQFYQANALK